MTFVDLSSLPCINLTAAAIHGGDLHRGVCWDTKAPESANGKYIKWLHTSHPPSSKCAEALRSQINAWPSFCCEAAAMSRGP